MNLLRPQSRTDSAAMRRTCEALGLRPHGEVQRLRQAWRSMPSCALEDLPWRISATIALARGSRAAACRLQAAGQSAGSSSPPGPHSESSPASPSRAALPCSSTLAARLLLRRLCLAAGLSSPLVGELAVRGLEGLPADRARGEGLRSACPRRRLAEGQSASEAALGDGLSRRARSGDLALLRVPLLCLLWCCLSPASAAAVLVACGPARWSVVLRISRRASSLSTCHACFPDGDVLPRPFTACLSVRPVCSARRGLPSARRASCCREASGRPRVPKTGFGSRRPSGPSGVLDGPGVGDPHSAAGGLGVSPDATR